MNVTVRLPNGNEDRFIDQDPRKGYLGRHTGFIRHRYEVRQDQSLAVFKDSYSAEYRQGMDFPEYGPLEMDSSRQVAFYQQAQWTSVRN